MSDNKKIFINKPQINISCPSTGRMWIVCGCVFLCILQSAFTDGGKSLVIAVVAFVVALLLEFLLTWRAHGANKIKDGSAAATALILAMMLPNQLHPVYAALGAAFAVFVVKFSFGGLGSNWLNPAIGGWLFIRFSWPVAYSNALEDSVFSVTEMTIASDTSKADNTLTEFLNNYVFSVVDVQMPSGYLDLLVNGNPGIIADRGLLAFLIGTVVITAVGINRGWIPLVFLVVYGFLIRLAGDFSGIAWNGDILYGILSGGTIAAAFILAAEPSTSAKLLPGVIFSVVLAAVLSWFFRYRCMEYSGCFIALALVNCLMPIIRLAEDKMFFTRIKQGLTKPGVNKQGLNKQGLNKRSDIQENVV